MVSSSYYISIKVFHGYNITLEHRLITIEHRAPVRDLSVQIAAKEIALKIIRKVYPQCIAIVINTEEANYVNFKVKELLDSVGLTVQTNI